MSSYNYLVQEVLDRARRRCDDTDSGDYDWDDDAWLPAFNDGRRAIANERPDSRILSTGDPVSLVDATLVTDEFLLDDKWAETCAAYMAFIYFGSDSGERTDLDRSQDNWDDFTKFLNIL